jgi:hypothetical protein
VAGRFVRWRAVPCGGSPTATGANPVLLKATPISAMIPTLATAFVSQRTPE